MPSFAATVLVLAFLAIGPAAAQPAIPVLRYTPPEGTLHLGAGPPDSYTFSQFNGQVDFYPFRPFTGDIRAAFQQTLLAGWIAPLHREQSLAAAPVFQDVQIQGADYAINAGFAENPGFVAKPHSRLLIVAGDHAALVDYTSNTLQTYQMAAPLLQAMGATIRVERAAATPPLAPSAGRAVAGLYQGIRQRPVTSAVNITGAISWANALDFYLLAPNGRVYHRFDALDVPAGDPARFDFDQAEQTDPENSGRFTIDGATLVMTMNRLNPRTVAAELSSPGRLVIEGVAYTRR